MAITGATSEEYEEFLAKGGTLILQLDREDCFSDDIELSANLKSRLYTGFELPPSPTIVEDPKSRAQIYRHGDQWTKTLTIVYARNGTIIYRKLPSGRFEAKLELPRLAGGV